MLHEAQPHAQHDARSGAQHADQPPFEEEDAADEPRIGPHGAQCDELRPLVQHEHHHRPHDRERGDDEHQQRNEEDAPLLVLHDRVERSVQLVARAHLERPARRLRHAPLHLRRTCAAGHADHGRRRPIGIGEELLRQPERGEEVAAVGLGVGREDPRHLRLPTRVALDGQQRRESGAAQGVEHAIGLAQRA